MPWLGPDSTVKVRVLPSISDPVRVILLAMSSEYKTRINLGVYLDTFHRVCWVKLMLILRRIRFMVVLKIKSNSGDYRKAGNVAI